MKKLIVLMLTVCTALLSGCWDANQPERMLYINGVGVDYQDGEYHIYAQIVDFANTAKSEQPTSDQPQVEVGFAKGDTMDEALYELYHSVDQRVFWGHFSYLVISEEIMENVKVSPIIDSFIRYHETRYQIWIYTTKDPVKDVLLVRPVINKAVTLSKLGDPENSYDQESFIYPVNIRKLIIGLNEPGHEAAIPLITVKENWESINEPVKAPELSGIAVITPEGFKGYISGDHARGLQWMTNETKRGQVTFNSEEGHHITVVIDKVKVKIKPVVKSSSIKFDVVVEVDGTLSTVKGDITKKQIEEGIKKEISKEIMDTFQDAIEKEIDVYRFSEQLYRKELNTWKKHQEKGRIELTEDSFGKLTVRVTTLNSDRKSFKETIKE